MTPPPVANRIARRSLAWRALVSIARTAPLPGAVLFFVIAAPARADDETFFETRIRPVLAEHCHECHSANAEKVRAGLRLDSRDALLAGGETGPAIVPGDPDASLILRAISYEDPDLQMPPRSRLPPEVASDFAEWIRRGAPWPGAPASSASPGARGQGGFDLAARRDEHWAWHPLADPDPPPVRDREWSRDPVDAFILARLEAENLRPAPPASRESLIRRATFVLTGLPPTPAEIRAFLDDERPEAFERLVDRLLASPAFGERWARHWLDKVRYAETMGHEFDYPIHGAWRYRDYVIRAFNADLPFDEFAREHIAGDLLDHPRRDPADGTNQSLIATLQYWFGQQVHSPVDVRNHQIEVIDNQIDVVTKAFLGLTVSCARCHDHKFDAISTRDYYALSGILSSSRFAIRAIDDPAPRRDSAVAIRGMRDIARRVLAEQLLGAIPASTAAAPLALRTGGAGEDGSPAPCIVAPREGDFPLSAEGWFPDGEAFEEHAGGQPLPPGDGHIRLVPSGWRHSGTLSRRFQGSLRSPTFTLDKPYIHLRLAGEGTRFTMAVEGFTLVRDPIYGTLRQPVRRAEPHWVTLDVSMWQGRRAWLEFNDVTLPDPATTLPASSCSPDGWIAVGEILFSEHSDPPPLLAPEPPADIQESIRRWRDEPERLTASEIAWIELRLRDLSLPEALARAWREEADSIAPPVLAGVMCDGTGMDEPVLIRGNHRTPGPVAPRGFLEALPAPARGLEFRRGSGRLALAHAITSAENPLFSRVAVNWVWGHLFGQGLVASADNFGALGEPPSHPELLDHLAREFQSGGWSLKALVRRLMTTRSWQMSSHVTDPAAEERDPDNRLLHRAHLRRLEGEAIRDSILALAGRLDRSTGGPSVPVHLTPFMEGRGRPGSSGPMDGDGRRSIYLEVRRNFLSPFMAAFDAPVPSTTVGRRTTSNVPAQSLTLMNDPFVLTHAAMWASRLLAETNDFTREDRVRSLYMEAFARLPDPEELRAAVEFLDDSADSAPGHAWAGLCHALFNTREFVFID